MRRVVVTGMAGLSPLGCEWDEIESVFRSGGTGITIAPEYSEHPSLKSRLAGKVPDSPLPAHYDRKRVRGMSRGALLSVRATEDALLDADLLHSEELSTGRAGVAYGSCLGGADMLMRLGGAWSTKNTRGILASSYVQVLSHCCAASISVFFQLRGRMIPTCSACTSASQAVGYSYEAIKHGHQDIMIAGGAEELCVGLTGLFDALGAASTASTEPPLAPLPFDERRDGLIVSEGAGTVVLEEMDRAIARGARIYGEVVGFGTNCDGTHITNPQTEHMRAVIKLALDDAGLPPAAIDYVHAHATGTELGDIAESHATAAVLGSRVAVGATKSFQGHTLGAAGALETWFSLKMMERNWFAPIRNLHCVDSRCAELDYVTGNGRVLEAEHVMVNNFAFGGVNTSLIFRRL